MNVREQLLWVEKYRPQKIEDCILPEDIKRIFVGIVNDGKIPNLLFSGSSGIGKTTVAKALCNQLNVDSIFINSSDERGISLARDTIPQFASSISLDGCRKVVILDEADNLTGDAQDALRGCIEQYSKNCGFIFTCNFKNKIKDALHSRFSHVDFKVKKEDREGILLQIARRTSQILETEGIEHNKKVIIELAHKFFPDIRRTLNELQKYSKFNHKIDEGILVQGPEANFVALFKAMKAGKYQDVRVWVSENADNDPVRLYRKFYEHADKYLVAKSIPQAVLHIGNYMYKHSFVADTEVNFLAFLTEVLRDCEFL